MSNFYLAFGNDLTIIPVLNKVDLPNADPDGVKEQLKTVFDIDPSTVLLASAKSGLGITQVLDAVIERIPPPNVKHGTPDGQLRLLSRVVESRNDLVFLNAHAFLDQYFEDLSRDF